MSPYETCSATIASGRECQDRVVVVNEGERTVIVVADGAGGTGSGSEAAETVIREASRFLPYVTSGDGWKHALTQIDFRIAAGESTAVVVDLAGGRLCGASVGDSQAWLIHDGSLLNLTEHQVRKPLLGSREAHVVPFELTELDGILIVATDGFCNYVKRASLLSEILHVPFPTIPRRLIEMVRLPSGEFWDDIGIAACRRRRPARRTERPPPTSSINE